MLNFLKAVLFYIFYVFWISISLLLCLISLLIPNRKDQKLKTNDVEDSTTICRILFERSKLTAEEYAFETEHVATAYSESAFTGYKFMAAPIIWFLLRGSFLDDSLLFLIRRWINVHHHFFENKALENKNQVPPLFHILFTKGCILIAKGTGKTLCLFDSSEQA